MSFVPETSLNENSRILIGGQSLLVKTGSVRENPAEVDTGCNLTGGYATRTRGRYNAEGQVESQWTVDQNPLGNAPTLYGGGTFTDLYVYPDFINDPGHRYYFPFFYVGAIAVQIGDQVVTYNFDFKNQGEYESPIQ